MLVVTRTNGESVIVTLEDGREIKVTVVEVRGAKVRMGLEAPRTILIDREEVAIRKRMAV